MNTIQFQRHTLLALYADDHSKAYVRFVRQYDLEISTISKTKNITEHWLAPFKKNDCLIQITTRFQFGEPSQIGPGCKNGKAL